MCKCANGALLCARLPESRVPCPESAQALTLSVVQAREKQLGLMARKRAESEERGRSRSIVERSGIIGEREKTRACAGRRIALILALRILRLFVPAARPQL